MIFLLSSSSTLISAKHIHSDLAKHQTPCQAVSESFPVSPDVSVGRGIEGLATPGWPVQFGIDKLGECVLGAKSLAIACWQMTEEVQSLAQV